MEKSENSYYFFYKMAKKCQEPIICLDKNDLVFFWNEEAEKIYGYRADEVIGKSLKELIVFEKYYEHYDLFIAKVREENTLRLNSYRRIKNKDGKPLSLLLYVHNIFNEVGHFLGTSILAQDLTKRKRLQKTMQDSEHQANMFTAYTLDGLILHDKGKIEEVNLAFCELLGYEKSEIIGQYFTSFLDKELYEEQILAKISKPTEKAIKLVIENKKGEKHFVEIETWNIKHKEKILQATSVRDISERQKLEKHLWEQEVFFQELFEQHSAVMLLIDFNTRKILKANKAAVNFYGYSTEQFEKLYISDLNILPIKEINAQMQKVNEGNQKYFEFKHLLANGEVRDVEVHSTPVFRDGRQLLFSIIHDITHKKVVEKAIIESESRYRLLFEQSNDGIFIHTFEGDILDVNQRACEILGYAYQEMLEKKTWELHPPEIKHYAEKGMALLKVKKTAKREAKMLKKDGTTIFCEISARVMDNGMVQGVIRDISEKKQSQKALQDSEERFALAVKGSNDGIWDWNILTNQTYFSPRWKEMLGYTDQELKDGIDVWQELIHPEDFRNIWNNLETYIEEGLNQFEAEMRMKHKEGHWIEVLSRAQVARDSKGNPTRLVGTHMDITRRRNTEKQLQTAYKKLQKSKTTLENLNQKLHQNNEYLNSYSKKIEVAFAKEHELKKELEKTLEELKSTQSQFVHTEKMASLGTLTAGIAHEINNPVNFIQNGIEVVEENVNFLIELLQHYQSIDEQLALINPNFAEEINTFKDNINLAFTLQKVEENIQNIKMGASRTTEIVKTLRNFSRLDEAELKKVNIHEGLDSTLVLLRNRLKYHVEIMKHYDPTIPLIECYPGQLNQVFLNLINNASQAIEDKGKIYIITQQKDDFVEIIIKDTGKGMPEEVRTRIFEPFFTTKPVGQGNGLGLSISYKIIEKHQGKISVDSKIKEGTTFTITLPIIQLKTTKT